MEESDISVEELDFSESANLDRLFASEVEEPEYVPLACTAWYTEDEHLLLKISTYGSFMAPWQFGG